jgi:hypothetical protein
MRKSNTFKIDHWMKLKWTIWSISNHKNIIIPKIIKPRINLMGHLNQTKNLQTPDNMYSHVESCNYTPPQENHPEASNSENLYFAGRVSRDTNPLTNAQNLGLPIGPRCVS